MPLRKLEEWAILVMFGAFSVFFYANTGQTQKYDLIFIHPLLALIGGTIAIVAVQIGMAQLKSRRAAAQGPEPAAAGDEDDETGSAGRSAGLGLLMLLVLFGIHYVGLLTSLFVFLLASMWLLGVRDKKTLVLAPVLMVGAIYVAFVIVLGIPLDPSPVGFY